ncbi:hypothetical protein Y032_0708g1710 [Ancylostoma ceylanicum]|uniref:Uncharacterized protein n=1 Tax=Ancylostoma ceylanicum TaxID=53326 RepID=A0A016WG63_9BILA|nr:hypothetical protein Y032_0708g1710 [Ancylostoma ceylanicum]
MELHPLFSFEKRKRKAERDKSEPKKKSIKSVINEMARKIDNLEKDMAKLVSQPRYGEDVPPLHLEKVVQRPATPPPVKCKFLQVMKASEEPQTFEFYTVIFLNKCCTANFLEQVLYCKL